MRIRENKNLKDKNSKKIKRQLSIITVFLWIFLVATMVAVVVGNIKNTNALEEDYVTVTYIYNDNVWNSEVLKESEVIVKNFDEIFDEIRDGYEFIGWGIYPSADEVVYKVGDTFTIDSDVTLCAVWNEKSTDENIVYKISWYDEDKTTVLETNKFNYGETEPMFSYELPTRAEDDFCFYKFKEWIKQETPLNDDYISYVATYTAILKGDGSNEYGSYVVKHEYYIKDNEENIKLEDTYISNVIEDIEVGKKVGVSNGDEIVDIELNMELIHKIDDKEYTYKYLENSGNIVIEKNVEKEIILRYVREKENETKIKVEKIWEDENNKYGKRPENIVLQIKNGEEVVAEMLVSEENNWSYEFVVPKYYKDGNEIEYTVDEKETDINYEKIIDGYKVINKYRVEENNKNEENNNNDIIKNEENVDTSDINIWMYVSIAIVSIVVIVLVIILVKKNDKKSK